MTKAWRTLGALGFITALALSGCVVTSGDGDDDETGGTGGTSGKGGSSATGGTGGTSATGGTGGTTGGTGGVAGGGGVAGSGGGGDPWVCENVDPSPGTAGDCKADDPSNTCQACVEQKCCTEMAACLATSPNNPCSFGGPQATDGTYPGEMNCVLECVAGGATPEDCFGNCTTAGCGMIDPATNDLWVCIDTGCLVECGLN